MYKQEIEIKLRMAKEGEAYFPVNRIQGNCQWNAHKNILMVMVKPINCHSYVLQVCSSHFLIASSKDPHTPCVGQAYYSATL